MASGHRPRALKPRTAARADARAEDAQGRQDAADSVLGQAEFRVVLYATGLSLCAFWMSDVACSWLMRVMTDADPFMTSLVQLALQLPVAVVLLPAGVMTDILDRVQLFLFAQAWMVAGTAAMWLAFVADRLSPIGLLLLIAMLGVGSALRMPNVTATVSDLVPKEQLTTALSLTSAVINGSRMVGPAVAGLILTLSGVAGVLAANVVMLVLATLWLRKLPSARAGQSALTRAVFKRSFLDGWRTMTASRERRRLLMMTAAYSGALTVIVALLPVLFDSSARYGLMYTTYGAGAVCGAFAMASLRSNRHLPLILRCGIATSALMLLVLAASAHPLGRGVALFAAGASWVAVLNASQVYAALALSSVQRGRGMSFLFMAAIGGMALGSPCWGWLAKTWGAETSFAAAAGGLCLLFLAFRLPRPHATA